MKRFRSAFCLLVLLMGFQSSARAQRADPVAIKGFHFDMRIQVMPMPALRTFVARLAANGVNTLIMEWEGSYPFRNEPLIANRYAYTRGQVADFISYCKTLHIQVIPLQQSFGHVEYILRNNKYAALREDQKDYSQVCPSEPELNRKLFTALYAELAATHQSPYIHIGGDETYLLGHCEKCRKKAGEKGLSRLYFDHIKMLCDIVVGMGKKPVVWADIALKYPEYISLLPKQTIFIDWNYGWALNRFGDHAKLLNSGYEIWGSPAIRSHPDNYFITDWQKHFNNIHDFIPLARKMKYSGIVLTSWSTSGVYSSLFGSEGELTDLYAIRHVYPLSGFNMLVDYYLNTVSAPEAPDVDAFIRQYAAKHYGFDAQQAAVFRKALFATPYQIENGKVVSDAHLSIADILDSAETALHALQSLQPAKGRQEFAHYILMGKIRLYYLKFMKIDAEVNAPAFTAEQAPVYARQLATLLRDAPGMDAAFRALNGEVLYPAAVTEENTLRSQKMQVLYDRLAKIR